MPSRQLLLWAPLAAEAQESTNIRRIGVLWPVLDDPTLEAFRQGLRGLGYIEGQNIVMEYRYAQGKMSSSLISRPNSSVSTSTSSSPGGACGPGGHALHPDDSHAVCRHS